MTEHPVTKRHHNDAPQSGMHVRTDVRKITRQRLAAFSISICLETPAFAGPLEDVLASCMDLNTEHAARVSMLESKGWKAPSDAQRIWFTEGFTLDQILGTYDEDEILEYGLSSYADEYEYSVEVVQNMINKSAPPFDAMDLELLAAPDGTVAEVSFYAGAGGALSCRIVPAPDADFDGAKKAVQQALPDGMETVQDDRFGPVDIFTSYDDQLNAVLLFSADKDALTKANPNGVGASLFVGINMRPKG